MAELGFEERMSGFVSFKQTSYNQAFVEGSGRRTRCEQRLTIHIPDVDTFIADENHSAQITGFVDCPELGGKLAVTEGHFNLLVPWEREQLPPPRERRRMLYRLFLEDGNGTPLTLSGFKDISHGPGLDGWGDYSRLLVRIFEGHLQDDPDAPSYEQDLLATGILELTTYRFMRLIMSMVHPGEPDGVGPAMRFGDFFLGRLWKLYFAGPPTHLNDEDWPSPTHLDVRSAGAAARNVAQARPSRRAVAADRPLRNGRRVPGHAAQHQDPLPRTGAPQGTGELLPHGSSVRANLFYGAPTERTIVRRLVELGYDVWLENWRGSVDLPASMWTLDHVAVYDHPAAVRKIADLTNATELKAVVHCQGSTSFMMSMLADRLPEDVTITHVVSNAVSLHVSLTPISKLKLLTLPVIAAPVVAGADPQWTARPPTLFARWFARYSARGRVCDSDVCRSSNFFYGAGPEVLWRHANLDHDTHEWNNREWGFCPTSFFKHMAKCALAGHLVPSGEVDGLPASFIGQPLPEETRFTFIAGKANTCFLPKSQERTFAYFEERQPNRHRLQLLPSYAHLDVFIGKHAHIDVFPHIVDGLEL